VVVEAGNRVGWPSRLVNTAHLAALAAIERRVPFWPSERIERRQRRRLRAMIRHAYGTVPFYRRVMDERGLRPEDVRTAEDLTRLPIVEREQLQRDPESFLSTAWPADRHVRLRSGGSTGAPRTVHHDAAALLANAAHGERERSIVSSLIGRRVGYRETDIATRFSSAAEVRRSAHAHSLIPARVRIERQYLSLLDPPADLACQIGAFRPDVLHGFGSAMALLFAYHRATGVGFHRPSVVTFSADAMPEAARRLIEIEYGIPVLGTYQAIEALKIGFECGHGRGYHLNTDLYPLRLVDPEGRDVAAGASGEVVVSNLVKRATVLLNYRLGDLATLAPAPCPCGRTLPLLASVDGRRDDIIALPSGRIVHPQALRSVFIAQPEVWQYQVVQETPTRFAAAVVAAPGADQDGLRERLATGLVARLGDPVAFDIRFVEALARTPGGKVRTIVCRYGGWDRWLDASAGGADDG